MQTEFPFPFFGAGEATCFEWAEVCVRFTREPAAGERAAIARRVPPPLAPAGDERDGGWEGPLLTAGSDQFAHVWIIESYPKDAGDETDDEVEGRVPVAAASRVRRFNEDIEAWLRFAHEQCPILAAYRPEDGESGGTELSAWHDWSITRADAVLAALGPAAAAARAAIEDDGHPGGDASVARGILWMAGDALQRSSVKT